jgi:SAM-dependent methyltransferase
VPPVESSAGRALPLDRCRSVAYQPRVRAPETAKRFDEAYFRRWYRSGVVSVQVPADTEREVALTLAIAESLLGRAVKSVLDVGCGEGQWRGFLKRRRRAIAYLGVDPSAFVVRRHGRRRNIRLGTLEHLDAAIGRRQFDLVVCSGVLNYLPERALRAGLRHVAQATRGVAYLELYTRRDHLHGDLEGIRRADAAFYRTLLRRAGVLPCGMHCYVPRRAAWRLAALEGPLS